MHGQPYYGELVSLARRLIDSGLYMVVFRWSWQYSSFGGASGGPQIDNQVTYQFGLETVGVER